MQCFPKSESVAHVTKKVRPPRNEILSSPLPYVRVPGIAIGTLRLRVSFHFENAPASAFPVATRLELVDKSCPWMNAKKRGYASARCRPGEEADNRVLALSLSKGEDG